MRSIFALILILFTTAAWAEDNGCEAAALVSEQFSRPPNDKQNGLITASVPMTTANLKASYARGMFPWIVDEQGIAQWFNPPMRGILDFNDLHISRTDMRFIRKHLDGHEFKVTFNKAFRRVIEECAAQPRAEGETWIAPKFIDEYTKFHEAGYAHSVEVWAGDELVGGLYGVFVNGVFAGESMFHKRSDVTKLAFFTLIERLKSQGHTFMDTQMAVGLTRQWGGKEIPRAEFLDRLKAAQALNLGF